MANYLIAAGYTVAERGVELTEVLSKAAKLDAYVSETMKKLKWSINWKKL